MSQKPFWETTELVDMSSQQWESLCDGCGRCCLEKLEDEDTGEVFYTDVVCEYLQEVEPYTDVRDDDDFDEDDVGEDDSRIAITDVSDKQADCSSGNDDYACKCSVYKNRNEKVPECILLKPEHLEELKWLPTTCAYRMIYEGKGLATWHPLISGTTRTVHEAQISVAGKVISGDKVPEDEWEDHIIEGIL